MGTMEMFDEMRRLNSVIAELKAALEATYFTDNKQIAELKAKAVRGDKEYADMFKLRGADAIEEMLKSGDVLIDEYSGTVMLADIEKYLAQLRGKQG